VGKIFSIKPAISIKGRRFKGIRGWAGKPFHPPLTDIPIGAYVLAMTFDVIAYICHSKDSSSSVARDFFVAATYVIIAGAIVSVPTLITGFWDYLKSMEKGTQAWRTANWHMAVMSTMSLIVVVNIIIRLGQWDDGHPSLLVAALSVIVGSLVSFGAAYGGSLVYDYEFNVEQDKGYAWEKSETDRLPGQEP
jgi:uncharacterized membrane protein